MIKINDTIIENKQFPDGTQCLFNIDTNAFVNTSNVTIIWYYENDSEMATLLFLKKHIEENNDFAKNNIVLKMLYIPNARMDRVKSKNEVFTLKYFCDFINYLNFRKVYVLDPHSDVSAALINNIEIIKPDTFIFKALYEIEDLGISSDYKNSTYIYFPDAGSMKRYKDMFPENNIIYGEKDREWNTGKIIGLKIFNQHGERLEATEENKPLKHKNILMVDDIISYGGTFAYSADKLKSLGASSIFAYASHVENSIIDDDRNLVRDRLNKGIIDKLYTTNSLYKGGTTDKIKVVNC